MLGEKPILFDPAMAQADSPVVAALKEKLAKNPPIRYEQQHKIEDLTIEQFSQNNNCQIEETKKIFTLYRQLSAKSPIPLRICNSILKLPGESVQILTNRLIDLVKNKPLNKI
jgi:hypothetical protein